jgi:ribosomal protein L19
VRSLVRAEVRAVSTQSSAEGARVKHRIPVKRASKLLNELKKEEFNNLKNGRQWPFFQSGDAIEIDKLPFMSAPSANTIKGVVIGISNKASDTNIRLLNSESGTMVYRIIPMYSPLIKDIRVIQKAFIHRGKKRVRRSKLYYLMDRHPDAYTVK